MDIFEHGASPNVDPIMKDIIGYDLTKYVVELEAYGVTVVPPEKMHSGAGFVHRLKSAILRTYEKRTGNVVGDPATAEAPPWTNEAADLLEEDEVFVEAAINPVMLTLVRWLCGQSAIFGGQVWIIKGAQSENISTHVDALGLPPGSGSIVHMCNASWICTDYEVDDGPTVFVAGSHKFGHGNMPMRRDSIVDGAPLSPLEAIVRGSPLKTFPATGKAGSLVIWNGITWHASIPRKSKGLRVTLAQSFTRPYMRPMINYSGKVSPQLLQKYPDLERIIGKPYFPYDNPQGPDSSRMKPIMIAGTDPYA